MSKLYYKNERGHYIPLVEEKAGKVRINDMWVDADFYIRFNEMIIQQQPSQEDNLPTEEIQVAFASIYKEKLITDEFLISKGWVKKRNLGNTESYYFHIPGTEKQCMFVKDWDMREGRETVYFVVFEYNLYDGVIYSGSIPTESQYEVLNQLLKLHP
jgi:hypothetical protein